MFGLPAGSPAASVEIRRRTGFAGEEKGSLRLVTVEEIIRFTASFYPRWRADLEQRYRGAFDLRGGRKVNALSCGMRWWRTPAATS